MIGLLLAWPLWLVLRWRDRRALAVAVAAELEAVTGQRDELRSRIEHAAPLWRREDDDFPGAWE